MSDPTTAESCHKSLIQQGKSDSYLGRFDELPELQSRLASLNNNLQLIESDLKYRLFRLMDDLKSDFIKYDSTIDDTVKNLHVIFAELNESSLNPVTNRRAAVALIQQVNQLSRRMRPRMFRSLERLSPNNQIIEKSVADLKSAHLKFIANQPEELWLLHGSTTDNKISGICIFDQEFMPQLEQLCGRPLLVSLKYRLLSFKCHFKYSFFRLPLRAIIADFLVIRSKIDAVKLINCHHTIHHELSRRLLDAWRGVRYNLETAAAELEDVHDSLRNGKTDEVQNKTEELRDIVFAALNNCSEVFDDINIVYASYLDAMFIDINRQHERSVESVKSGIEDADKFHLRLKWIAQAQKAKWQAGIVLFKKNSRNNFSSFGKYIIAKAYKYIYLPEILAKKQTDEEVLLKLSELPTEQELLEKARELPPIYRRLFKNEALVNREFQVAMEEEMELLVSIYKRWKLGKVSSVAIVGPEGSGKTSLINCFEVEIEADIKVARVELHHRLTSSEDVMRMIENIFAIDQPCKSIAELIRVLQKLEQQMVIVEHGHQLFLRTIGSRQAIETFFYILINTRQNIFWIISFRYHPWVRMGYLYQVERYFTHVVNSQFHNSEELKQALLLRQGTTGQDPVYSSEGINAYRLNKYLAKNGSHDAEAQKIIAEKYFDNLYSISGGNMETALYYWLKSLSINADEQVIVAPCFKLDNSFIKKLDSIYLISLAEVLAHGGLTPKEYAEIFNLQSLRSRLILDYLRHIRLLQGENLDKHGQPQFYTVNPLFYHPVYSVLSALHILY